MQAASPSAPMLRRPPALLDLLLSSGFRIHLQPCSGTNRPFIQHDAALACDLQLHIVARCA